MSNCNPAGPSESIVGCNSGDTGCRSWPSVTSNPEATVSGNITCSNLGANGWCVGSATLNISSNEPMAGFSILSVEGTRNGATFACAGSSCSVPLSEGNNDFSFWALSSWGDSSSMGSASEGIDTQPPLVSGQLAGVTGDGGWFVSSVSATVTASDATSGIGSIAYSLDGGPQTAYPGAVTLGDGLHTIVFNARDRAGNSSSVSLSANVDTVLPSVAIDSPSGTLGDNGWYVSGAALGASAGDAGSGLASLEYSLDGGPSTAYTGPVALPDGVDTIVFTATDHAGNSASRSATVNVDTTAPQLTLNAFNAFCPACNEKLAIDYIAADNGSSVAEWTLLADGITLANGVAAESGTFEWDGSGLTPGAHTLSLQAKDLAGNVAQTQMIVTLATPTPTPSGLNIPILKLPLIIHPVNPLAANTATPNTQSGGGGQPTSIPTAAVPTATRTNSIIVAMGNPVEGSNAGQSISNPATTSPLIPNAALFGAEAAAAISAAMAVVVAQQRKRQEEEAQAAAASAAFNATQVALEEERRREAAQRAWDKKQQDEAKAAEEAASAAFESKLSEAMGWGLRPQDAGYYSSMAQTDGYAAAIAALSAYIEQAKEALSAWEKAQKEAEERKRKEAEEKARKEADEKARQEAEAAAAAQQAAAAAAAAETEKNKPWWQKAWDNLTTGVTAIVQGSQAIIDKFYSDPVGLFEGAMIALGNSGPIGKAVVTTLSNIVFGVTDIVKTVFYPPPGTTNMDRVIASTKLVGMAFIGAYLGIELITGGAMTTAIIASAEEALGITGAGATAAEVCEIHNCIQTATDALSDLNEFVYGSIPTNPIAWDDVAVIGKYIEGNPASYEQIGSGVGANIFNIDPNVYNQLSDAEKLVANQEFLDKIFTNRWYVYLTSPIDSAKVGTSFWTELQFLSGKGYTLSPDGNWLIPPVP